MTVSVEPMLIACRLSVLPLFWLPSSSIAARKAVTEVTPVSDTLDHADARGNAGLRNVRGGRRSRRPDASRELPHLNLCDRAETKHGWAKLRRPREAGGMKQNRGRH